MSQSNQQAQALSVSPRGILCFGSQLNCELSQGFELNGKAADRRRAVSTALTQKTVA